MIYTAAVGGRPRGALLSHANLIAASAAASASLVADAGRRQSRRSAAVSCRRSRDAARGAICRRRERLSCRNSTPAPRCRRFETERVTMLAEFPPILTTLLDAAESRPAALSSLRIATGLDSPETITRFERLCPQARFWSVFGQIGDVGLRHDGPISRQAGCGGKPTILATVAVLDDADKPIAAGETGEIAVRGPTVFKGYWKCDADTAFTFRNGLAPHRRSGRLRCRRLSLVQRPLAGQGTDKVGRRECLPRRGRARDRGAPGDRRGRGARRSRPAMGRSDQGGLHAAKPDRP